MKIEIGENDENILQNPSKMDLEKLEKMEFGPVCLSLTLYNSLEMSH